MICIFDLTVFDKMGHKQRKEVEFLSDFEMSPDPKLHKLSEHSMSTRRQS